MRLTHLVLHNHDMTLLNDTNLTQQLPHALDALKRRIRNVPILTTKDTYKTFNWLEDNYTIVVDDNRNNLMSRGVYKSSIDEALDFAGTVANDLVILGGKGLYRRTLPDVDIIESYCVRPGGSGKEYPVEQIDRDIECLEANVFKRYCYFMFGVE